MELPPPEQLPPTFWPCREKALRFARYVGVGARASTTRSILTADAVKNANRDYNAFALFANSGAVMRITRDIRGRAK